ncbi:MAG: YihY/virulence factor BrkB family protein [Aquisalimonadaceae bacterium]
MQVRRKAVYWWAVWRDAGQLWNDRNAFTYAGALAFYTLFSLAPVVIIAVAVIGTVFGEEAAHGQIVGTLEETIGPQAAAAVEEAVARSRVGYAGWLPTVLGMGALLVGATTVFAQMQISLNAIWGVTAKPTRSSMLILLKNRLLSLTVVLAIGFILMVSLVLSLAMRAMLRFTEPWIPTPGIVVDSGEFLVSLLVLAVLFGMIYKVLPDVVISWRDVASGALVTALLFSLGRYAVSIYLIYTAPDSTYGAAGSLVILLLWVYYSSLILLFGAAFTKVHMLARGRKVVPRNLAVAVRSEIVDQP